MSARRFYVLKATDKFGTDWYLGNDGQMQAPVRERKFALGDHDYASAHGSRRRALQHTNTAGFNWRIVPVRVGK